MVNELPGWVVPIITSVLTGAGTLLAAVLSYRNQRKKIMQEFTQSEDAKQRGMRELDLTEFKEISAGNKALRDALLERIRMEERDLKLIKDQHRECEQRLNRAEAELRRLGVRLDLLEVHYDEDTAYRSSR